MALTLRTVKRFGAEASLGLAPLVKSVLDFTDFRFQMVKSVLNAVKPGQYVLGNYLAGNGGQYFLKVVAGQIVFRQGIFLGWVARHWWLPFGLWLPVGQPNFRWSNSSRVTLKPGPVLSTRTQEVCFSDRTPGCVFLLTEDYGLGGFAWTIFSSRKAWICAGVQTIRCPSLQ